MSRLAYQHISTLSLSFAAMPNNPETRRFYEARLDSLELHLASLKRRKNLLSGLRLGAVAALLLMIYFLYNLGLAYMLMAIALIVFIFTRLLLRDLANRDAIRLQEALIAINKDELKAISHQYYHFPNGDGYKPAEHPYALDLDILGHASLYQFCNRSTSDMGAATLADWLLHPANPEEILARQSAVQELSGSMEWNQQVAAHGRITQIKDSTWQRMAGWLQEPTIFLQWRPWQWLRYLLPAIILGIIALRIAGMVSMNVLYTFLFLYAVLAFQLNKLIAPVHNRLSRIVDEINALGKTAMLVESAAFTSPWLQQLQVHYTGQGGKASGEISRLRRILDRLDLRYNIVVSFPLNVLLLWNLQQVLDLEKWKQSHTASVAGWFSALGNLEAILSFATLRFNHPAWCLPSLEDQHFYIEATGMGHPLINPEKRIDNPISIHHDASIMLVTGSNMAGKSTYLRSVGVNVVLAMAGAPVCAVSFRLSPVQLLSSMRITDNLEESTSTFYAELKKLKSIIEKVNNHEKVFVLLDEILRGTNSNDRHKGSVALVRQMIKESAAGIIATHDLALADLKESYPANISNFHFDVQVSNEELYFDYTLKPGVCTSMNASILMKKIGIEL